MDVYIWQPQKFKFYKLHEELTSYVGGLGHDFAAVLSQLGNHISIFV